MGFFNKLFGSNLEDLLKECEHTYEIIDATLVENITTRREFGVEVFRENRVITTVINRCTKCGYIDQVKINGRADNILANFSNCTETENKDVKDE